MGAAKRKKDKTEVSLPPMKWEWKFGPAFIGMLLNLLILSGTLFTVWASLQSDVAAAKASTVELKRQSSEFTSELARYGERLKAVETAILFIVPAVQRIDDNTRVERKK